MAGCMTWGIRAGAGLLVGGARSKHGWLSDWGSPGAGADPLVSR